MANVLRQIGITPALINMRKRLAGDRLSTRIRDERRKLNFNWSGKSPSIPQSRAEIALEGVALLLVSASIFAAILLSFAPSLAAISSNLPLIKPEALSQLLQSLATALAAIFGVGIPIFLLLLERVAERASVLTEPILAQTGIRRTTVMGLVVLMMLLLGQLGVSVTPLNDPALALPLSIVATMATLAPFLSILRVMLFLPTYISPNNLQRVATHYLRSELRHHLNAEVDYRLARQATGSVYQAAQFHHYVGFEYVAEYVAITWHKTGWIRDIDLRKLAAALSSEEFKETSPARAKGFYLRNAFEYVEKGLPAFYIRCRQEKSGKIARRLFSAFTISRNQPRSSATRDILGWVKRDSLTAIRDNSADDFVGAIEQLCGVLRSSSHLPHVSSGELDKYIFGLGEWDHSFWVIADIEEITAAAARSPNESFLRIIAYSLMDVLRYATLNGNAEHQGDIPAILNVFPFAYDTCLKGGKVALALAVYSALITSFLEPYEFWKTAGTRRGIQELKRRFNIFFQTLRTAAIMMRWTIDDKVPSVIPELVQKISPRELAGANVPTGQWARDKWSIQAVLDQDLPEDTKKMLRDELEASELLDSLPQSVETQFSEYCFAAASYVLEGLELGLLNTQQAQQLIAPLWDATGDATSLLRLFESSQAAQRMFAGKIFDRVPDSHVISLPDTEYKYHLGFCIRGLRFAADARLPDEVDLVGFANYVPGIKRCLADLRQDTRVDWADLLGLDAKSFRRAFKAFEAFISQKNNAGKSGKVQP